jgi:hypothetical protein
MHLLLLPANPFTPVLVRGRVVEWLEGDAAWEIIDRISPNRSSTSGCRRAVARGSRKSPKAGTRRLQQADRELLTSEGWQRWVRFRSRAGLARLSLSNPLLAALRGRTRNSSRGSRAGCGSDTASRRSRRRFGSSLRCRSRSATATGEETGETLVLFKTVFVFDRAQVAPIDGWSRRRSSHPASR